MTQNLIVIGAGMATGRAIEHLLKADPEAYDITLFNAEPRGNYDRIMLSPVLAGDKTYDEIVIHTSEWYGLRKRLHPTQARCWRMTSFCSAPALTPS